jgi:hypothetical protein
MLASFAQVPTTDHLAITTFTHFSAIFPAISSLLLDFPYFFDRSGRAAPSSCDPSASGRASTLAGRQPALN